MTKKKPTFPSETFKHTSPLTGKDFQIGDGGAHFTLDAAKVKEAVEDQTRWAEAATSPYIGLSPAMAQVFKARREINDWHEGLQRAEIALATAKTDEAKAEAERVRTHYATVLAESFATLGQFDMALAMSPMGDKLKRQEYQDLLDALSRTKDCPCTLENHPFLVTLDRVHRTVFNPATGQMQTIVACNVCNQLSVKGVSAELAKQRNARAQAIEIAGDRSPADAHRLLKERGLTAQNVFGLQR